MRNFSKEYRSLDFVIKNAGRVLLFAHTRPDPDAVGANIAFREYIRSLGKTADIACFDRLPAFGAHLFPDVIFRHPDEVDFGSYDAIIASDSVDRGFDKIKVNIPENTVIALIDHHPDIKVTGDIEIIDTEFSSSSEIVYHFLTSQGKRISEKIATPILLGILGDTGGLQHSNTKPETMTIASELIRRGARLSKIADLVFCNKKLHTLKLWGKALSKARFNERTGMIYSALTKEDLNELGNPETEELYAAATLLDQAPDAKFSLLFYQIDSNTIRGSLRTEPHKNMDVSLIARHLGGGGHKLASGFEINGRIIETADGWVVV